MVTVYPTKRDAWITVLLWISAGIMILVAVDLFDAPAAMTFRIGMSVLLLASASFIFWVFYGTRYTLTAGELIIRCGPFRWTVKLASIEEIFPTHNPLSSPAGSLDRLRVCYDGGGFGIMISPLDKRAFLGDLVSRVSGLRVKGEGGLGAAQKLIHILRGPMV